MTRDQIIEQLFTGRNFREAIEKMEPAHLRDDLKMEVIAEVCEWSDEKIVDLHSRGRLGFYVAKVMLFMVINKYSPFYKKYRIETAEWFEGRTEAWDDEFKDNLDTSFEADGRRRKGIANRGIAVEINDIQVREVRELTEDQALSTIDELHWYEKGLIDLYIKHGTYRAIEAETGIPWESAYKSIQKSLKHIRCQVTKLSSTPL